MPSGRCSYCQAWVSKPAEPVADDSSPPATAGSTGRVPPRRAAQSAPRSAGPPPRSRRFARPSQRRWPDGRAHRSCPTVGTRPGLLARTRRAASTWPLSRPHVPPTTTDLAARELLRLVEASPPLSPGSFCDLRRSGSLAIHFPASLGSTVVTRFPATTDALTPARRLFGPFPAMNTACPRRVSLITAEGTAGHSVSNHQRNVRGSPGCQRLLTASAGFAFP